MAFPHWVMHWMMDIGAEKTSLDFDTLDALDKYGTHRMTRYNHIIPTTSNFVFRGISGQYLVSVEVYLVDLSCSQSPKASTLMATLRGTIVSMRA